MSSELLTIVIPTRDRTDLLELCLRSVFERQTIVPNVIVSDNSTVDHNEIEVLRRKYGFAYVRQSGKLGIPEHHNACLRLATTRWVWMLHDDDELCPDAVTKIESFLTGCQEVGIVVGGVEHIDAQSKARRRWIPNQTGILTGEEALLGLGLNWDSVAPAQIFGVRESAQVGGYADIGGLPADYRFAVLLAYAYGVAFYPEPIGRYRSGHEQASNFLSSPEKLEAWLLFSRRQAELLIRDSACSPAAAERIMDFICWWSFRNLASRWSGSHPAFFFKLAKQSLQASPRRGEWQNRVRKDFPFLFWRLQWLAWPLYRVLRKCRYVVKLIFRGRLEILIYRLKSAKATRLS
jgi:hypothetical protein